MHNHCQTKSRDQGTTQVRQRHNLKTEAEFKTSNIFYVGEGRDSEYGKSKYVKTR